MSKREKDLSWVKKIDPKFDSKVRTTISCDDLINCKGGRLCAQEDRWVRAVANGKSPEELVEIANECAEFCPSLFGAALNIAKGEQPEKKRTTDYSLEYWQNELKRVNAELAKIPLGQKHNSEFYIERRRINSRISSFKLKEKKKQK